MLLLTIQIGPIASSINEFSGSESQQEDFQEIRASTNIVPPQILRYLSPPEEVWGIEYDLIESFSHIATFVFDPLVEYSFETGELVPALAKQWVVSNDSKHWIFTLRENLTFHDGSKFNATSVKFTYDRFIDPAHPAFVPVPMIDLRELPLESVEILDDYKVSINFNESYAPFIYKEAPMVGIYSPNSFGGGPNVTIPIGTGPYYLDTIASNATFQKFIRNDQHFRGVPPFEQIQYFKYSSQEDFEADVEDHDGDLTTINVNTLPESDVYWEESLSVDGIHYGIFNHLRPIIDNPNVRLAINYAINKQRYVNQPFANLNKGVDPLRSVIFSGDPYHDESIQGYPYNIELANSILDNAGYPRLGDGYRFEIELGGNVKDTIEEDLDLIGIRCTFVTVPDFFSGNYDLFTLGWVPLMDPSVTRTLLHSSGVWNPGGYSNTEIDLYTDLGQQTPVRQEREYYYSQVQQIAQEDAPLLLLQETMGVYLRSKTVTPFIKMDDVGRLIFNYSTQIQDIDVYTMEEIEISSDPIYFPFTDGLVTLQDQHIEGNMTMTHDLKNLIPDQQEEGKFYELLVNNSELEYQIRCYYDLDEIQSTERLQEQEIFLWDSGTQSWNSLELIASDTDLRFSEIQLKGNVILRLGKIDLILLTFRYLPIIVIIIGPIVALISIIIIKNQRLMKKIEEEFDFSSI
jgi:peptide/nickel transport system substrate-binding protein